MLEKFHATRGVSWLQDSGHLEYDVWRRILDGLMLKTEALQSSGKSGTTRSVTAPHPRRTSHFASRDKLLLLTHMDESPPLSVSTILKIFSLVFLLSGSAKKMRELYVKLQFRPELCSSVSYSFPQLLGPQS